MHGNDLSELIELRWQLLQRLLEISQRQINAIDGSRMTELMRILSEKQPPLNQLAEVAQQLRPAAEDDPESRVWDSDEQRRRCRQQQEECEKMHLELLAVEAECETALMKSRDKIQEELKRVDNARQAVTSYASQHVLPDSGGNLDLSSDA